MLNALISMIGTVLGWLFSILPDSPFQIMMDSSVITSAISSFNWFFPITEMLATMQLWLTAIIVYYVIVVPMRFAKLIDE